ncbi:MAG: hypothetical protein ABI743_13175 [bacterium]
MSTPHTGTVVAFITDFFFVAKIEAPLRTLGLFSVFAQTEVEYFAAMHKYLPTLSIIDLGLKGVDPIDIIRKAKGDPPLEAIPLLCFGSHVMVDKLQAARDAGAEEVVSSGQFSAHLPTLVSQYL